MIRRLVFTIFLYILLIYIIDHVKYDDLTIKRCNLNGNFTIHGFWPEYNIHSWPSWCNKSKYNEFNISEITPILKLLNDYWYSCPEWNITNYYFWKKEWEKHGTCMFQYTVIEYFNRTINTFIEARDNNWYGCCNNATYQCMIPFHISPNNITWLGYCH